MSQSTKSDEESQTKLTFDMLRVTPNPTTVNTNPNNDRLTDFLFIIFIFGISYWFRFLFYYTFTAVYGTTFDIVIADTDPLGFGAFLGLQPGETANTNGYNDFFAYYIPYVDAFEGGWNPYTGNQVEGDSIGGYVYGPFYMYSIFIGKGWFGLSTIESIVYSNIIIDSLTYVMVYILAKRVTGNVIALIFALVGSFSPISLYFIAYRGLNAPIMNLVFLLFIYFYLEKRDNLSLLFLAMAILTKQFPLFMAMPVGLWMVRRYGFAKGIGYYLKFFAYIIILSIPYIFWTPVDYGIRLFLPGGSKSFISCPNGPEATNLFHSIIPVEACLVNGSDYVGIDLSALPSGYKFLFLIVNTHILFFASIIFLSYVGFTAFDYLEERPKLYYVFFAAYYGIVHATIARGIYKYYLTFLVPLFLLGFIVGSREKSLHIKLGDMFNNNWKTWFNPRYRQKEASLIYWMYGLVLLVATSGIIWLIVAATELISFNNNNQGLFITIYLLLAGYFLIKPKTEIKKFDENKSSVKRNSYLMQIAFYGLVFSLALFVANPIADYYFNDGDDYYNNFFILFLTLLSIGILPFYQSKITNSNHIITPFRFNYYQTIMDVIGIALVYFIMLFFHVQTLTIFRFYITLFILVFSFIFLGMLGNQVWASTVKAPLHFIQQYDKIRSFGRGANIYKKEVFEDINEISRNEIIKINPLCVICGEIIIDQNTLKSNMNESLNYLKCCNSFAHKEHLSKWLSDSKFCIICGKEDPPFKNIEII